MHVMGTQRGCLAVVTPAKLNGPFTHIISSQPFAAALRPPAGDNRKLGVIVTGPA